VTEGFAAVYALTPAKDEIEGLGIGGRSSECYDIILNMVKKKAEEYRIDLKPRQVAMDFEQALRKSFKNMWPEIKILGCYFHLLQAIVKRMKHTGVYRLRRKSIALTMIQRLAFVPECHVKHCFEQVNIYVT